MTFEILTTATSPATHATLATRATRAPHAPSAPTHVSHFPGRAARAGVLALLATHGAALAQTVEIVDPAGFVPGGESVSVSVIEVTDTDVFMAGEVLLPPQWAPFPYIRRTDGTVEVLPILANGWAVWARAISLDGTTVAGAGHNGADPHTVLARWVNGAVQRMQAAPQHPVVPPDRFMAIGGNRIIATACFPGPSQCTVWMWEGDAPPVEIPTLPPYEIGQYSLMGVSDDGEVVVLRTNEPWHGGCERLLVWTPAGGTQLVAAPNIGLYSFDALSRNGRYITFRGMTSPCPSGEFDPPSEWPYMRWDTVTNTGIAILDALPEDCDERSLQLHAISNDGALGIGGVSCSGVHMQVLWTAEGGFIPLLAGFTKFGFDFTGWSTVNCTHMAGDGRTFVGRGWYKGQRRHFIARRPAVDMADSDSDGIPNDWEANGIPYTDHEGVARRYPLPQANPLRKNLWVEVDAMQGQALPEGFFQPVVQAFADAPVTNPDGSTGVTLHIQMDEGNVPPVSPLNTDADYPFASMDAIMNLRFGTPAEQAAADRNQRLGARKLAFRYCLIADESTDETLGFARDIPADDFIIFRGHFLEGDKGLCEACDLEMWMRSTFMHELGHCLGLRHGGHEDMNLKPNYISTMNYLRQVPFKMNEELWRLDYSRGTMAPLNECCLNELTGFIDAKGFNIGTQTHYAATHMLYKENSHCDTPIANAASIPVGGSLVVLGGAPVDFNNDGNISEALVAADLNYYGAGSTVASSQPSPCQVLEDHDDWRALKYRTVALTAVLGGDDDDADDDGGTAGAGGGAAGGNTRSGLRCLTAAMVQELMVRMPDPAPACGPADLNCDGLVNGADLGALLAAWGPCTRCNADITGDGEVNGADLGALLAAWTTR